MVGVWGKAAPISDPSETFYLQTAAPAPIIRAFLGGPEMRCEDYLSVSETEHSRNYGMEEYEPALAQVFCALHRKNHAEICP